MIESWVLEKLEPLRKESTIILRDPQRMIRRGDRAVDGWAEEARFSVLWVSGNLGLRDMYEEIRDDPSVKVLLVDRTREPAQSVIDDTIPEWGGADLALLPLVDRERAIGPGR